jgi:ATP-dependent Lhr-like helicase
LTAEKSRAMLSTARTVIVDEIHAVADDKRGSHLALSLARLERLTCHEAGSKGRAKRLQRIGLSATVKPIEQVASFLGQTFSKDPAAGAAPVPRTDSANHAGSGRIIQVGHRREMKLAVEVPKDELGPITSNEMWAEIYDRLAELIRSHQTTLVFVNTRRLAERVTHHLQQRLGEGVVLPHHGSLSRKLRLSAEQRLRAGDLRAVVATASLELGIDIGFVDLVCQIGSPRSIAVALQRIGRSGHWVGATPEGRLFVTTRDELIECAALVHAIRAGELDRLEIPQAPLDILAQQMVAAVACEEFGEDELFNLVRATYPYRNLPRADFDAVLEMMAEGIASSRGHSGAYLHRDQVNHRLRPRRGARLAAITSGGAIPDSAQYLVVAEPEGATVGSLDEDFAIESMAGDVFLLGTTSWRIRRIEPGRVRVEDAHGAAPTIPFWTREAPGRTAELSEEISRVREGISTRVDERAPDPNEAAVKFLESECGLNRPGAKQAVEYVRAGEKALGALPGSATVVAERFFDESGGMQLVIHSPFGARINRAWGLALRKRFCRSFNLELQAAATDNGIVISLSEQHAFPLEVVFEFLTPQTLEHVLTQALLDSPMFTVRWRWNLSRALAVLRFSFGRKTPPPIQRMRAEDMRAAVFPDQAACAENLDGEIRIPDHPLVKETIENCLYEAMDLAGLRSLIEGIGKGRVRTVAIDTAEPSPFCHEILNANPYAFLDDAPLEERRTRAVQMRRTLSADMVEGPGALDAEAIAQVADEAWPLVRDADELHDALLTLVVLPPTPEWEDYFAELSQAGRATTLQVPIEFPQSPESPEHTPAPEPTGPPEQSRARTGAVEPTDDLEPTGDASDAAVTTSFWTAAERLALVSRSRPESPYPSDPTVTPHSRLAGSLRRRDLAWLARLQRAGNRR